MKAWVVALLFISSLSVASEELYLTGADAFVTECSTDGNCTREAGNYLMMIPLQSRSPHSLTGSFSDFAHLPTGELFSYEFTAVETPNKIQIIMNCKFESQDGETLFQCPKKVNSAKKRSDLKSFLFSKQLTVGPKNYLIRMNYAAVE